ncbi:DUF3667 domain-containing protein, partial [Gemmatimonadota bacterium]
MIPSLGGWLKEALDEVLLVEARFPKTLRALAWPPGKLTQEWWQGRRATYVSPLRLYFLAAIPFFFLVAVEAKKAAWETVGILEIMVWEGYSTTHDASPYEVSLDPLPAELRDDSLARAEWRREFEELRAENRAAREAESQGVGAGVQRTTDLLPIAVGIIMVPFLAILLAVASRPRRPFVAGLVLSFHLHMVGYVLAILSWAIGWGLVPGALGATLYLGVARQRTESESIIISAGVAFGILILY